MCRATLASVCLLLVLTSRGWWTSKLCQLNILAILLSMVSMHYKVTPFMITTK